MNRSTFWRWLIVAALPIVLTLGGAAVAQRETNARQDERIRALEMNLAQLREDIREIKKMIEIMFRERAANG